MKISWFLNSSDSSDSDLVASAVELDKIQQPPSEKSLPAFYLFIYF